MSFSGHHFSGRVPPLNLRRIWEESPPTDNTRLPVLLSKEVKTSMHMTTLAALAALLLVGATAAVLMTAAGQDVTGLGGTTAGSTNSTSAACPAQGNDTAALRFAFLIGNGSAPLPPFLTLNQTAFNDWLTANGLNASSLAACAVHPHAHGFGPDFGPRQARCQQNQTA